MTKTSTKHKKEVNIYREEEGKQSNLSYYRYRYRRRRERVRKQEIQERP